MLASPWIVALAFLFAAGPPQATSSLDVRERVVAGGPGDFLTARHLRLAGSNFEIGRHLAELAKERHGSRPGRSIDPITNRARRAYFARTYPAHLERMRGVAVAFGGKLTDERHDYGGLGFGFGPPGCSVVYYPPSWTKDGRGILSRNFDFTTGTMRGQVPGRGEVAVCSQPYVLELHPDKGYASIALCAYDLLGGVVDGMNEKGLCIALLADDEISGEGHEAAPHPQPGFGVVEIGRYLLETCADVEEAKAALIEAKLYYTSIPCHYILADAKGDSFIWENSPTMHFGHVIEGKGEPQVTTNFLLHRRPELAALPAEQVPSNPCGRYRTLRRRLATAKGKIDRAFVVETNASVAACAPSSRSFAPGRTLWHALYYPEQWRMEVDFYLGEAQATENGASPIRRSKYVSFELSSR